MKHAIVPMALAVLAGMSVVMQQVLNSNLKIALGSAAWAGFASYVVGTLCMFFVALAMAEPFQLPQALRTSPWWLWLGGAFGAVFIGLAIILIPQLGAATFFALLLTGQVLTSLALDHSGAFGLDRRPIDAYRLLGAAMLIGGVLLIRR